MRLSTLKQEAMKVWLKNDITVYICVDQRAEYGGILIYYMEFMIPSYAKLAFVIKPKNKK